LQEKVFSLLLDVGRIDQGIVANMRDWKHSGFSVDTSVRIEAGDHPFHFDNSSVQASNGIVLKTFSKFSSLPKSQRQKNDTKYSLVKTMVIIFIL
jgi:hypothetical protein